MSELDATIEELKRLHAASLACIGRTKSWDIGYYGHGTDTGKFNEAIHNAWPSILAEREAMRAKLEAAQRLRDATSKLIEQGDLQTVRLFKDFGQLIDEKYADASNKAIDALAAFDKETE